MLTTGLYSCGQGGKQTPITNTIELEIVESQRNLEKQKKQTLHDGKSIDTQYEYTDSVGKRLIIQNSFPRGGLRYIDPNGVDFVYAIFWTRITNETANSLEFTINFPADSIGLPSSTNTFFYLLLPTDTMTIDKEQMFDYGLVDLKSHLDRDLHKTSSLQRTIKSGKSYAFYVTTLFNKGVDGVLRTALSSKDQTLFYKVNDKEFQCGQISFGKLK